MIPKSPIKVIMALTDSRRLTGPNLILDGPGAAAEIALPNDERDEALKLWLVHIRVLLESVGWSHQSSATRLYENGATIAISAPIDALYAATEIVEAAWDFAVAELGQTKAPELGKIIEDLIKDIHTEQNPALRDLQSGADARGVTLLTDDEMVTLGLGCGSQSWPSDNLPDPEDVSWGNISDIPTALVTGTNGKSTTVRIAAAIGAAAGLTVGFSSSDWVKAGKAVIATGDYSGPEGARLALRDKRVDMAVIETARGGLLRRGLPISKATACLITNVAADHLGDYGILDVEALADTKFTVSKAVRDSGTLILNADDKRLKARGEAFAGDVAWYGLSLGKDDCPRTGRAAFVDLDVLTLSQDGEQIPILPVKDFAPALGGAAAYNVSNALGAILLMAHMGVALAALKQGLLDFGSTPEDNPGRGNLIEVGGVKILLDFAHNPHGLKALTEGLTNVPAKRRLYLCGQGGDRSNDDIFQLTKIIHGADPEVIIVKELPAKLRGREPGEVPALITQYLSDLNYPASQIIQADSEFEAVMKAFAWAEPEDLLVLLVYAERDKVFELIEKLQSENWAPGQPVAF